MNSIQTEVIQEAAKIQCNFEQVEAAIKEKLSEYEGAVFTEDSKAYAKKEVAGLRAEQKRFKDSLREEKAKYMAPWNQFEAQANQLIALYDEPINLINGQIQAFEEKRIAEKKKLINEIYQSMIGDLSDFLPLERIYNPKWENATFKQKDIQAEIGSLVESVHTGIETISSMDSEACEKALSMYRSSLDLTEAISYINNYERQKQEILAKEQERRRQEEEERIRREERERLIREQEAQMKAEEEKAAAVEQAKAEAAQEVIDSLIPDADAETELYEYRVSLSKDAKEKLEMYMDSVGIEWEMIV